MCTGEKKNFYGWLSEYKNIFSLRVSCSLFYIIYEALKFELLKFAERKTSGTTGSSPKLCENYRPIHRLVPVGSFEMDTFILNWLATCTLYWMPVGTDSSIERNTSGRLLERLRHVIIISSHF